EAPRRAPGRGALGPGRPDRPGPRRRRRRGQHRLDRAARAGPGLPRLAAAVAAVPAGGGRDVGGLRRGPARRAVGRGGGGGAVPGAVPRRGGRMRRGRAARAAGVVAYDASGQHAPRWVWLDEAMTGVDAAIKASFMGLTVDFELDVMLTAHDEWCNYRTVPVVAVYDLARQPHLPGVDAVPYL